MRTQPYLMKFYLYLKYGIMKCTGVIFTVFVSILIHSCERSDEPVNHYEFVSEIVIPTSSPRGLASDGDYLWYSDDSLQTLNKIAADGRILKTIKLTNCKIAGFDFAHEFIWCINDTTVLYDTTLSPYPFSCIYKLSLSGDKIDSILIRAAVNPEKPEFPGLTVKGNNILGSTNQGYSSCLYMIDLHSKEKIFLRYLYLAGLATHNDTIYCIDKSHLKANWIVPLDTDYQIIEDESVEIDFQATDLTFIHDDLWLCDRKNKTLPKLK